MKSFLNKDKITKEDLEGLAIKLLKNRFKNSVELEYNLEKCYLTMTERIDWTNLKGVRFHTDMSKPLPLEEPPSRKIIPMRYFFNKDIEYLNHGNKEKKYALLLSKIKAARDNRQWFYKGSIGRPSTHDVFSKIKIISVQRIKVDKRYGYGYLEEIMVKRADLKEYMFAKANFPRLTQNDIEDLNLLKIQDKVHSLVGFDEFDLTNALQFYIRRIMIKKRVEDAQLRVPYTTMSNTKGFVYLGNDKQKMMMRADEIHKFSDGTLNKVYDKLSVMVRDNMFGYGNEAIKYHEWTKKDKERTR
ncbi:hypothetical protein Tco_0870304 [Tanacetum coccineum]